MKLARNISQPARTLRTSVDGTKKPTWPNYPPTACANCT